MNRERPQLEPSSEEERVFPAAEPEDKSERGKIEKEKRLAKPEGYEDQGYRDEPDYGEDGDDDEEECYRRGYSPQEGKA